MNTFIKLMNTVKQANQFPWCVCMLFISLSLGDQYVVGGENSISATGKLYHLNFIVVFH